MQLSSKKPHSGGQAHANNQLVMMSSQPENIRTEGDHMRSINETTATNHSSSHKTGGGKGQMVRMLT